MECECWLVNTSYTSDCLRSSASCVEGFTGSAVICGRYLPLGAFTLTLSSPNISLKSSSADGLVAAERGRSWLARSVARAMKVESGRVTPRVAWMRFWTDITDESETGMAISVSVSPTLGSGAFGFWVSFSRDAHIALGEAGLMLLRSICPSLVIRIDCSEEYDDDILPRYPRTSPLSNRPLGPLAGILSASELDRPFSWSNWAMDGYRG